jgi:NADH-quinone oxidoreductase subunit M
MSHLLSLVLVTPLVGAAAILLVDCRRTVVLRLVAMAAAALALVAALPLWFMFVPRGDQWQFTERVALAPTAGVNYFVGIDGVGLLFVLVATLAGAIAMAASWRVPPPHVKRFLMAALALEASAVGVFVALDFVLLTACWIAALLSLSVLIRSCGDTNRQRGVTATDALAMLSCLLLVAGVAMLYARGHAAAGIYTFDIGAFHALALAPAAQTWPFLAFLLAIAAPVAVLGLFARASDSDADDSRTPAIWIITIGLAMSVFGIARIVLPIFPAAARTFAPALTIAMAIGALLSGALAIAERGWLRVVTCAAVAEWCLVVLALFALTPDSLTGALVYAVSVVITAAALFAATGNVAVRGLAMLVFVAAPALAGWRVAVPSIWTIDKPAATVAIGVVVLIAAAFALSFVRMLGGIERRDEAVRGAQWRDGLLAAALGAIAIAVAVHPAPVLARLETSVARVVLRVSPQYAPQVSDCLTAPPPKVPESSGLPSGMLLAAPCEVGAPK